MMVLGDDPIVHRLCYAENKFYLQDWFAWVELQAWARVGGYYADYKPKEIFLVIGQHLSPSYAITHQRNHSFVCEVQVEATGGLPNVMDGEAFSHVAINKARASFGFERCSRSDTQDHSIHYSVFLSTYSSRRVQLFKRPLLQLISTQYQ